MLIRDIINETTTAGGIASFSHPIGKVLKRPNPSIYGKKKKTTEDLHEIIKSKNRSKAGYSVPAQGLFLTRIEYPASIYK